MWVVAVGAVLIRWLVDVIGALEQLDVLFMTTAAQLEALCNEQAVAVRCMWIVTLVARTKPGRTVPVFLFDDLSLVTRKAEPAEVLVVDIEEKCFHLAAMRIVAVETVLLSGLVQQFRFLDLSTEFLVATKTILGLFFRFEVMEVSVLNMTSLALPRLDHLGPMEMGLFRKRVVAARAHA